ncbi:DNA polymerase III subunit alpha [Mycoplasmopsis lipofaciens]|uniref:DNA polymerase III subunit alpha n=1 Tax=Mycoplasmopsis lipofaciens TaxID=114884 RepID=UPI00048197D4|nr:DNA polymerase III subunit alpha [Mycoplasmopsis lipofaciens]
MNKFINLYNTTEYTFLDSLIKVEELVKKSKENGLEAVCLTDHNNMFGLGIFLKSCKKFNIKPIIGVDLDVDKYRFILLAKNYKGYQKINNLILRKSKSQPLEITELDDENIFVLDHPTLGFYAQNQQNLQFKNQNYFINSEDVSINNAIKIKTNKVLYSEDNDTLKILQQLNSNTIDKNYYNDYFIDIEVNSIITERINNIVKQCNVVFPKKELKLPKFDRENSEKIFIELIEKSIENNKKELLPYKNIFIERINYEFDVIKKLGYIDYFLIIQDLVNWAKKQNIAIGPGRGSAAGSLISYLLNITTINPLKYNLLFERFLNSDRVSWPDIDIDIQDDRRNEVFNYLKEKYGSKNTALISTFQTIGPKMAIRDIGRVLNISLGIINNICKLLERENDLEHAYQKNLAFKVAIDQIDDNKGLVLLKHAIKIQNLPRQQSFHAAGFIIANDSIVNIAPTSLSNVDDFQQVQLTMDYIEDFGLLKIDLLGLKTLTEIKMIEENIENEKHFDLLVKNNAQELNDPTTFAMLNMGFTEGLFQLESNGMKSTIKKVMIESFEDLYAIISLFRPGPKTYISEYAKIKKNPKLMDQIHPEYDEIVKPTNGIIVYQEQIMQIAQKIGGLTYSQADILRRAISKKKEMDIQLYRNLFFQNALKKGIKEKIINDIYNNIEKFALYGFNKSHAVCYAYITMKMAYYKSRYPLLFYSSLISNCAGAQATINKYSAEIKSMNYIVHSPEITKSLNKCRIYNNELYLPFTMIKNFGNEGINKILKDIQDNGFYPQNITEILMRLKFAGLTDNQIKILISANCFRNFGNIKHIENVFNQIQDIYNLVKNYNSFKEAYDKLNNMGYLNLSFENSEDIDINYEMDKELFYLGETYNVFPTSKYEKNYKYKLKDIQSNKIEKCAVQVVEIKLFKNKEFFLIIVKDSSTRVEFFINKKLYNKYSPLKINDIIELHVSYNTRSNKLKIEDWKEIK